MAALYTIYGRDDLTLLDSGGSDIYLFPPDDVYTSATIEDAKDAMSMMFWADSDRRTIQPEIRRWCTPTSEGIQFQLTNKQVTFEPNNHAPIHKKTGTYDTATLQWSAYDIVLSGGHYIDMMGDRRVVDFFPKPPTSIGREIGTEMISVGPVKIDREAFVAVATLGSNIEGRRVLFWFYGNIIVDFDTTLSINDPITAQVQMSLLPFPNFAMPNGLPAYMVVETPVLRQTVTP